MSAQSSSSCTASAKDKTLNIFKIGDTIKKTIDHAFVLGTALVAAVILAPAAVAWDPYEPAIYPDNSIHLAADIVNLTPTVVDPRPAPVAVVSAEPVVTTPFVTVPAEVPVTVPVATTMPATWGCFLIPTETSGICFVFPTLVGVFPIRAFLQMNAKRLPHARGGVSILTTGSRW